MVDPARSLSIPWRRLTGDELVCAAPTRSDFLLAWLGFVYVYCPLAQWRNESLFRGPRELTFDDHGVGCITPVSETRLRWSFFTGMIETDRCWVLLRRAQCIPVPKAAFASAADLERFRTLVAEQVKPSA